MKRKFQGNPGLPHLKKQFTKLSVMETMAQNLLCQATIPHIFQSKFRKVKHATPKNK